MTRLATVFFAIVLTGVLLASCIQFALPREAPTQSQTYALSPSPGERRVDPAATVTPSPSPSQTHEQEPVVYPDISDLRFADLADMEFALSNGSGIWCTHVEISPDGTFSGYHFGQDIDNTGPDYPNGTQYYCSFNGKFSSLKKTGDYEYSMKCESIIQEGTADETEIGEDGVRYITSIPYGFDNADEFLLYLPGKKLNKLPEMFLWWMQINYERLDSESADVLDFYGLYNVRGEQGFSASIAPKEVGALPFNFDAAGNYTGFDTVPPNYTIEQAIEDGCYIRKSTSEFGGSDSWRGFIENSKAGKESDVRIMLNFDEGTYYSDLFYIDGSYRVFDSSSEDLKDHEFRYLLELNGRMPNAERDSYYVVLTDDETLSFNDITRAMLSSSLTEIQSISPFKIVIMGVV